MKSAIPNVLMDFLTDACHIWNGWQSRTDAVVSYIFFFKLKIRDRCIYLLEYRLSPFSSFIYPFLSHPLAVDDALVFSCHSGRPLPCLLIQTVLLHCATLLLQLSHLVTRDDVLGRERESLIIIIDNIQLNIFSVHICPCIY